MEWGAGGIPLQGFSCVCEKWAFVSNTMRSEGKGQDCRARCTCLALTWIEFTSRLQNIILCMADIAGPLNSDPSKLAKWKFNEQKNFRIRLMSLTDQPTVQHIERSVFKTGYKMNTNFFRFKWPLDTGLCLRLTSYLKHLVVFRAVMVIGKFLFNCLIMQEETANISTGTPMIPNEEENILNTGITEKHAQHLQISHVVVTRIHFLENKAEQGRRSGREQKVNLMGKKGISSAPKACSPAGTVILDKSTDIYLSWWPTVPLTGEKIVIYISEDGESLSSCTEKTVQSRSREKKG